MHPLWSPLTILDPKPKPKHQSSFMFTAASQVVVIRMYACMNMCVRDAHAQRSVTACGAWGAPRCLLSRLTRPPPVHPPTSCAMELEFVTRIRECIRLPEPLQLTRVQRPFGWRGAGECGGQGSIQHANARHHQRLLRQPVLRPGRVASTRGGAERKVYGFNGQDMMARHGWWMPAAYTRSWPPARFPAATFVS
jgi:hypothetical protein